jgi:hypothetical protein
MISFTRFCCGLFLIHSISFDLIALTVDVSDGSQFADVRHDDLIVELLPRCSLVQIEIRSRLHRDECHRRPENLVSPFFVTWLTGFVANSEVAQGTVFVRSKSFVTVSNRPAEEGGGSRRHRLKPGRRPHPYEEKESLPYAF